MATLIVLTVLLLACGGYSVYKQRQQEQIDYEDYMANRIAFDASEVNADK